jgi:hypothetical protein
MLLAYLFVTVVAVALLVYYGLGRTWPVSVMAGTVAGLIIGIPLALYLTDMEMSQCYNAVMAAFAAIAVGAITLVVTSPYRS